MQQVAANIALVKNLTLHGIFWGSYMKYNPRVLRSGLQELTKWFGEGKITVPVSHRQEHSVPDGALTIEIHEPVRQHK